MPDRDRRPLTVGSQADELVRFYEDAYSSDESDAELYSRWRALGALGKADHVIALCARAKMRPGRTLEIGCGDGALLGELGRRGFGGRLSGVEIAEPAVALARQRAEIAEVDGYDGERLPFGAAAFDLAILSHVLEHVPRPAELLVEATRVARAVVFEVPLEANVSAARREKRRHAAEVGHLHNLDRSAARRLAGAAGLRVVAELEDPLPRAVHRFFARSRAAKAAASAKWALRKSLHRLAPGLARSLFTVHYACVCTRED
jgi:SAM-dependent methyltransferase